MCWRSQLLINPSCLWAEPQPPRALQNEIGLKPLQRRYTSCLSESPWNGAFVLIECCQSNVSLLSFFLLQTACLRLRRFRGSHRPLGSSDEPHQLHETCPASNATQVSSSCTSARCNCEVKVWLAPTVSSLTTFWTLKLPLKLTPASLSAAPNSLNPSAKCFDCWFCIFLTTIWESLQGKQCFFIVLQPYLDEISS